MSSDDHVSNSANNADKACDTYASRRDFRRGGNERVEGVYTQYMTDGEQVSNNADKACAKRIDKLLPQTQCGDCGFDACLPYAQALAKGLTTIDRCAPGGQKTLLALADQLDIDPGPYLSQLKQKPFPVTAAITEQDCIGCTKCIQHCPVDAIVGAQGLMHVILSTDCTGCGLCVAPCPVDCITLTSVPVPLYDQDKARNQYHAKQRRLIRNADEKGQAYIEKKRQLLASTSGEKAVQMKRDYILQAIERKKQRTADEAP